MASGLSFSDRVHSSVQRLAESGVAALGGLFDLTSQRLVRYATALTGNQHNAEDAVQAALVRVAANPQLLIRAAHPWPYLLAMVRNEALAADRRNRRYAGLPQLADLVSHCPVDEMEREESYRAVWAALRQLPPPQAEVIVLKLWEEMTFAQVAHLLQLNADTAASRYRYGMRKLALLLGAAQGEHVHD